MNPEGYYPNDISRELGDDAADDALDEFVREYEAAKLSYINDLKAKLKEYNDILDTMRAEMCDELACIWTDAAETVHGQSLEGDPRDFFDEFSRTITLEDLES